VAAQSDPGIQRRRLRVELRKARAAVGMTQRQAADELEWSLSKLIRIEAASVSTSVTDLRAMLALYGVTDAELVKSLTQAARTSKGQAWWSPYRDLVSPQFAQYLGHEGCASSIRSSHPFLIPGLLHTADYAAALLRAHHAVDERIVDLRLARQENLFGGMRSPEIEFVFGEEALYRLIGGRAVMRDQLHHLRTASDWSGVSVQIVPFSSGAHPGLLGPFVILGLEDSAEDLLFVESVGGDLLSRDDREKIDQFIEHFEIVRKLALSRDQTMKLLEKVIHQLDQHEAGNSDPSAGLGELRPPAGLGQPDALSGLTDLGEVRWGCSHAGAKSPPSRVRNARISSSRSSGSFPESHAGPAASSPSSSPSSASSSLAAALASRL
jgi:transcriptional regulator with XRE-family HTH domain